MALDELGDGDLAALWGRYGVQLFDVTSGAGFGVPLNEEELSREGAARAPAPPALRDALRSSRARK